MERTGFQEKRCSPLSCAIKQDDVPIVRLLLADSGTDIQVKNFIEREWSYLSFAKKCGNKSIIKLIEDKMEASKPTVEMLQPAPDPISQEKLNEPSSPSTQH